MFDALGTSAPVPTQHDPRHQLGQVLLERGLLTDDQLRYALEEQARSGLPLGQVLIGLSYVTASTIAQALATQHGGLLKTEYGFATGFDSNTTVETAGPPPLVPAMPPAPLTSAQPSLRIAEPQPQLATVTLLPTAQPPAAPSPVAELELEIAAARQVEETARRDEMLARQELAAAQASAGQLGAAAARIAELEASHAEMKRQLQASLERSEHLERELSEMRMGTVDELQRTQRELAQTTESLRAAYARLHELETAGAVRPQQHAEQPAHAASPFAWQA